MKKSLDGFIKKGQSEHMKFIITDSRKRTATFSQTVYVVARPGYCRTANGEYQRDGSFKGGPEWGEKREHAFKFATKRSAEIVRSKTISGKIVEVAE